MRKIKHRKRKATISTAAAMSLAASLGTATPPVWAEEDQDGDSNAGMIVSPMNQKMILVPGETYTGTVRIGSPSSATLPLKYSVSVGSFSQIAGESSLDDYGDVDIESKSSYNQMMDWISFDKTNGEVQPNESDTVTYTINVPQDAPAGGQYATLLFTNDTVVDPNSGGISIQSVAQVASVIYASVSGKTREEGRILENNMDGFLAGGQLKASSMVENAGNIHTDATYTLQVHSLFGGDEICATTDEPTQSLVLPGTKRYHVESCDLGTFGIYDARQTVSIFDETSVFDRTIIVYPTILPIALIVTLFIAIMLLVMCKIRRKKSKDASRYL